MSKDPATVASVLNQTTTVTQAARVLNCSRQALTIYKSKHIRRECTYFAVNLDVWALKREGPLMSRSPKEVAAALNQHPTIPKTAEALGVSKGGMMHYMRQFIRKRCVYYPKNARAFTPVPESEVA